MSIFGQTQGASQPTFGTAAPTFGVPAQNSFRGPVQNAAPQFGANQQTSQSIFGGAQSSQSLFGATTQSSQSLFGAPTQAPSLFGASQQSSASLFRGQAQSASLFGAPQQSSASLFGAPATQPSLFGAQAQSTTASFGAPGSSSSLFGAPAQGASLFGAQSQNPPSLFGAAPQQQQPQQSQSQTSEINLRTRVWQLPQNFQTDLFAVERHLREQRIKGTQLLSTGSNFDSDIAQTKTRSTNITRRLAKLRAVLEALRANSETLKAAVRIERGSTEPVVLALENLSKNSFRSEAVLFDDAFSFNYHGSSVQMRDRVTHVPEDYFSRTLDELESRAHEYKREIDEIAEFLRAKGLVLSRSGGKSAIAPSSHSATGTANGSLLDSISQRQFGIGLGANDMSMESRGKTIEDIIRRQYEYFMVVASHIGGVHENLWALREQFLQLLRVRDPDALNPFELADRREKAEEQRRQSAENKAAENGFGFSMNESANPAAAAAGQSAPLNIQGGSTGAAGGIFGAVGNTGSSDKGASLFGGGSSTGAGLFGQTSGSGANQDSSLNPGPNPASNAAKRLATGRRKR
ncbi:unnamed protein product [Chondrus crispus]|uniref:Nucleoporin Nup54 alpha-helical domain-containing protein n=1 Tax=Chondrus crispus TaxID=2769 RepID=R7QKY7_CHOCR|nr:unnamed protein product [Chondrus crispus]CDF38428.1 unnamed protein product [Chondrus crispus]|eukprot:XP_005718321.1 unnamed protein product [Chondrus crispus]